MPSRLTPTTAERAVALLALFLLPLLCGAVRLDLHVPLPEGCFRHYALLANRLLREASRPPASPTEDGGAEDAPRPSERVDLLSRHTPHVTLYLADFHLEDDGNATQALNQTRVVEFLGTIGSLNFTDILAGWHCPLSYAQEPSTSAYFDINGAFAMLPVEDTPCLQTLSTTLLHSLQDYLRQPVEVPSWVASLPEPDRGAAIFRSRTYGSPNVLENFSPHVTVGFDPTAAGADATPAASGAVRSGVWRAAAMQRWNAAYERVRGTCLDEAQGVAVGRTGAEGTVLANARLGYWDLTVGGTAPGEGSVAREAQDGKGDSVAVE